MNAIISLKEWLPWYNKIRNTFRYNRSKDQYATAVLSHLLSCRSFDIKELRVLFSCQPVLVFGAGPSLEENLRQSAKENLFERCVVVSADGATTALLKLAKVVPNVVVTDLDGDINDLLRASKFGSVMVVHGHGDNIDRLQRYVPKFEKVIGTTQVNPKPNVYNLGGFTDGDRAVFLAVVMGARLIALAGMDLGEVVGKYSKKRIKSIEVKLLKLKICKELLEWLASKVNIPLYNITEHGENISGFINIASSELAKIVEN